jgi:hypothetical protein
MLKTLSLSFAAAAAMALTFSAPAFAGDDDCTIAKDASTEVGAACKKGGIKRAKKVMKTMTRKAKKQGMRVDCDSCHKNETDWELTDDAEKQFKEMVALIK